MREESGSFQSLRIPMLPVQVGWAPEDRWETLVSGARQPLGSGPAFDLPQQPGCSRPEQLPETPSQVWSPGVLHGQTPKEHALCDWKPRGVQPLAATSVFLKG